MDALRGNVEATSGAHGSTGSEDLAIPSTSTGITHHKVLSSVAGSGKKVGKSSKAADGKGRPPRKRKYADVEGKPKQPKSAYNFFMSDAQRELKDSKGFEQGQKFKVISEKWASMDPEQKKKYEEMADQERQRYRDEMKEFEANYTKQMSSSAAANANGRKKNVKQKQKTGSLKSSGDTAKKPGKFKVTKVGNPTFTFQMGSGAKKNVCVFSEEFLKQNKDLEAELRAVKRSTHALEEDNAAVERQIEQLIQETTKLEADTRDKNSEIESCETYCSAVKQKFIKDFSSLPVPDPNGGPPFNPKAENISTYCEQLGKLFKSGQCPPKFMAYREVFRHTNWPA